MSNYLNGKRILLGITGGIAAYKTLELIRRLRDHGAEIKVILSANASSFVTPLSIQALSNNPVFTHTISTTNETAMSHIELARWAEVLVVAPASANFLAKYANGIADDLLTTVCLATTVPVLLAPAMNQQMWLHPATQHNLNILQNRSVNILGPANGSQACGEIGPGRMLEALELLNLLEIHFAPKILTGKHLVITAGPTQEAIDPVRYLSNHSSGKMGYALANAALKLGAKVTLISGPTSLELPSNQNMTFIRVTTAAEMLSSVLSSLGETNQLADIFIGCAAVADYRPTQIFESKLKKNNALLNLKLEPTTDILATVAALPINLRPLTIGFAAETENLLVNANNKLVSKALDFIVANSVAAGKTFNQDFSEVTILGKNQSQVSIPEMPKEQLAFRILEEIVRTSAA